MLLKHYLKAKDLTYTAFAKRVDVSRVTVMKWSEGRIMPRPVNVLAVYEATQGQVALADHYRAYVQYNEDIAV
jgi:transcriptional regulator with XRE-family HTH domain